VASISIDEVILESSKDPLWAIRGKAIQSYASLEMSLCGLFQSLTDLKADVATIIFFSVFKTGSVHEMLDKLIKHRHGATYTTFWNSLKKQLGALSNTRNEIVHWTVVNNIDGTGFAGLTLHPQGFWIKPPAPSKSILELVQFMEACDFLGRLCNMFSIFINPRQLMNPQMALEFQNKPPWPEVFQNPVEFPPPVGHPLYPKGDSA
jgi:hypothetical protein